MGALGLMGVFAFAIGGTITFSMLFFVLTRGNEIQGNSVSVFGFLGFLLIGLGIWLILRDVKPESNK